MKNKGISTTEKQMYFKKYKEICSKLFNLIYNIIM